MWNISTSKMNFFEDNSQREIKDIMMMDVNKFLQKLDFTIDFFNDDKLQGFDGVFFSFKPGEMLKLRMPKAKAEGRAVMRENRIYYVYFTGVFDRQAEKFLSSFRFIN